MNDTTTAPQRRIGFWHRWIIVPVWARITVLLLGLYHFAYEMVSFPRETLIAIAIGGPIAWVLITLVQRGNKQQPRPDKDKDELATEATWRWPLWFVIALVALFVLGDIQITVHMITTR